MTLWRKCIQVRQECASGYAFVGKRLAMDVDVLSILEVIKSTSQKERLIGYIQNSQDCSLLDFWTVRSMEEEDLFWTEILNRRSEWLRGKRRTEDTMVFGMEITI